MRARIYQPARSAMQSGQAKTKTWILEFAPEMTRSLDPLMGWTSSADTQSQVKMGFDTQEAAVKYARENGLNYALSAPHNRRPIIRNGGYGENFATKRRGSWTH
ncbi:MAG: ETC complex I subunit [Alphaproteobacteria bacterium]|nr:ETC complex I subunit [Alphaproteobacteria bacterium]